MRFLGGDVGSHQRTQPRRIDERNSAEVNDQVGRGFGANQVLESKHGVYTQWAFQAHDALAGMGAVCNDCLHVLDGHEARL